MAPTCAKTVPQKEGPAGCTGKARQAPLMDTVPRTSCRKEGTWRAPTPAPAASLLLSLPPHRRTGPQSSLAVCWAAAAPRLSLLPAAATASHPRGSLWRSVVPAFWSLARSLLLVVSVAEGICGGPEQEGGSSLLDGHPQRPRSPFPRRSPGDLTACPRLHLPMSRCSYMSMLAKRDLRAPLPHQRWRVSTLNLGWARTCTLLIDCGGNEDTVPGLSLALGRLRPLGTCLPPGQQGWGS